MLNEHPGLDVGDQPPGRSAPPSFRVFCLVRGFTPRRALSGQNREPGEIREQSAFTELNLTLPSQALWPSTGRIPQTCRRQIQAQLRVHSLHLSANAAMWVWAAALALRLRSARDLRRKRASDRLEQFVEDRGCFAICLARSLPWRERPTEAIFLRRNKGGPPPQRFSILPARMPSPRAPDKARRAPLGFGAVAQTPDQQTGAAAVAIPPPSPENARPASPPPGRAQSSMRARNLSATGGCLCLLA